MVYLKIVWYQEFNLNCCGVCPVAFLKYFTKWEASEKSSSYEISETVLEV